MALQPISKEQVERSLQVVLAYLEHPGQSTPNDMLDGIVSGKSLIRAILAGGLVVCQSQPQPTAEPPEVPEPEVPEVPDERHTPETPRAAKKKKKAA